MAAKRAEIKPDPVLPPDAPPYIQQAFDELRQQIAALTDRLLKLETRADNAGIADP